MRAVHGNDHGSDNDDGSDANQEQPSTTQIVVSSNDTSNPAK
jgi:hypothetical protein